MLTGAKWSPRLSLFSRSNVKHLRCKLHDPERTQASISKEKAALMHARERINQLISGVRDDELELIWLSFEEMPRGEKINVVVQACGILVVSSIIFSSLCGADPTGGFDVFHPSVRHWAEGIGAATPWIVLRVILWAPFMPSYIQEFKKRKKQNLDFILKSFNLSDALLLNVLLTFSWTLFLYPGVIGSLTAVGQLIFKHWDGVGEQNLAFEVAVFFVSGIFGFLCANQISLYENDVNTLKDAAKNSGRYYQLTMPSNTDPQKAQRYANAFQKASDKYLSDNLVACGIEASLKVLECCYGSFLWKLTGDISTTLCFFICLSLVEVLDLKYDE